MNQHVGLHGFLEESFGISDSRPTSEHLPATPSVFYVEVASSTVTPQAISMTPPGFGHSQHVEHANDAITPTELSCSPERPLVPSCAADWEARKHIIQDLYMDKNLILNEVIGIMLKKHKFKATARMYKGQFAKWKWTKYNKSGSAVSRKPTKSRAAKKKGIEFELSPRTTSTTTTAISRQTRHLPGATYSQLIRFLHFDETDLEMQLTLHAYAVMISHWCERETPWRVPYTTTDHNNASALARPPRPQRISILQQFRAALDNFRSGRPQHGGNLLRQAFLNIERAVLETAQAALDMEAVWDCCLAIPQLILQSTEAWTDPDGLLPIFANHFYQLCKLKLANNNIHHPLMRIAETLRRLCHPSRAGDDKMMMHRPQLWLYIRRAWHLWLDRVTRVRGRQDEMAIHLRRGYVTLMIPVDAYGDNSTTTGSDMAQAHNLIGDFCEAVQRSLATRGSFATTARILELERLLCRMYLPLFTDESAARANNMLVGVVERVQGKHKHEDEGNGGRANMAEWHFLDRYLVFSANYFLSCIAEYSGERDLAVEYRRRSLDAPRDLFWLQTTMVLEEELRLMGYQEEANAVMEERMKEQEMYVTTSLEGNQLLLPGLQVGEKREGV